MKKYLYALAVAAVGLAALYFMLWQMRLGDFAESPQRVLVTRDINRLVAGGKAGIVYEGKYRNREAKLLVRCKDTADLVRLEEGEESDEVCGVFLLLEDLRSETEVIVQVRWD